MAVGFLSGSGRSVVAAIAAAITAALAFLFAVAIAAAIARTFAQALAIALALAAALIAVTRAVALLAASSGSRALGHGNSGGHKEAGKKGDDHFRFHVLFFLFSGFLEGRKRPPFTG